jgi:hypothetical protein
LQLAILGVKADQVPQGTADQQLAPAKFHQDGRYMRFWGNHDDAWSHSDLVEKWLVPVFGGHPLKVREGLIVHVRDGDKELGRLFLVHGHQGTLDSSRFAQLFKFLLRYFWRPAQRILKYSFNNPRQGFYTAL